MKLGHGRQEGGRREVQSKQHKSGDEVAVMQLESTYILLAQVQGPTIVAAKEAGKCSSQVGRGVLLLNGRGGWIWAVRGQLRFPLWVFKY